ncbi:MAG: lysozyme [Burkholderiaceae bacterium]|nr:lysozyme [Burkholderiaceae bacterium]
MPAPLRDVPQEGIELIKSFEGIPDGDPRSVNLDAYLDPVGIWTIGWSHAITHQGTVLRGPQNRGIARALYPGGITLAQAEMLLRGELVNFARDVLRLAKVALDDGQFAALVSFAFNCGSANLATSTLLRRLNSGDLAGAADQFLLWNRARKNGALVELPGLTRRRRAERAMFLGQDWRAVSATGTRGGAQLARTTAPERPEPPPDQEVEELPAAPKAKKVRAATKTPLPPVTTAAPEAAKAATVVEGTPALEKAPAAGKAQAAKPAPARKEPPAVNKPPAAKKAPVAAKAPAAKQPAKPRARTTTPTAPPKAPPAKRPAPRTKR